jgi:hypothetical protein
VNVFIASSPLQLFNCVEARNRFHQNQDNHLLFVYKKTIDLEQARPLLDDRWASKAFFKWTKFSRLLYGFTLRSYLKRFRTAESLYLGYPYNIRAHFANSLDARVWIVDDGNYSVWLFEQLDKQKSEIWRAPSLMDRLLRRRVSTEYLKRAGFFTAYPLLEKKSHEVICNDFRGIKATLQEVRQAEGVAFIGSPVIGALVSTESQFLAVMTQVSKHFCGQRIRYLAHRYENVDYLRRLLKGLNFEVIRCSTLVELQFALDGFKPRVAVSLFSSALVNLGLIYDIPMTAFRVPDDWIPPKRKDICRLIYKQLEQDGVSITPLVVKRA